MNGGRGRRRAAFEQFCSEEYGQLVASVTLMLGDRDVATDAVDEAFARAWVRVRRGQDIESLGGWIRVVAINYARDQFRRQAVASKHTATLMHAASNDASHAGWGTTIDVGRALDKLPQRQREVATLHFVHDLTVNDIAHALRISPGTVKTTLQKARAALIASLRESSEGIGTRDAS